MDGGNTPAAHPIDNFLGEIFKVYCRDHYMINFPKKNKG